MGYPLGWETTGQWTAIEEEDDFMAWAATQPGVTTATMGTTLEGRPIRLAALGNPIRGTFFIVGGVHGREPAGREVALMVLRDYITSDPTRFLHHHRLVVMPTQNPDGRAHNTRNNSVDGSTGGDMYGLEHAEVQALTDALHQYPPTMLADLHQYNGDGIHWFWPKGNILPSTAPELRALSNEAVQASMTAAESQGYPSTPYPNAYRSSTSDGSPRHFLGMLAETRAIDFTRSEAIEVLRLATDTWIQFFRDNWGRLRDAHYASLRRAFHHPGPETVNLRTKGVTEAGTQDIAIAGYQLAEPIPTRQLEAFSIEVDPDGFVPLRQAARPVLPEILDSQSMFKVTTAARTAVLAGRRLKDAYVLASGSPRRVVRVIHQTQDGPRDIHLTASQIGPTLLRNGTFRDGLDGWYEYGATPGTYSVTPEHDGKGPALHLHGDGEVRLEHPLTLDRDGLILQVTADVWIGQAGDRPGQVQLASGGSIVSTLINPQSGDLAPGWGTVTGTVNLAALGRTEFGLRIAQIATAQVHTAYWRITQVEIL